MRAVWIVLLAAAGLRAEPWPLERLFTRPYAWGTPPERMTWSRKGHTLVFLWNAGGGRFLDLYAYHPERRQLVRLTNLEGVDDPINRTPVEKDPRQNQYLPPPEGITDFSLDDDGGRAAFTCRGDLYFVATSGAQPPFRLTRTRTSESAPWFSPDGSTLAFIRDGQLFVRDLAAPRVWQVTTVEGEGNALTGYRWSPDGKRFVYTVRQGNGRRLLLPNYSGKFVTAAPFPRTVAGDPAVDIHAYVIAADGSGEPQAVEPGPWGAKVYSMGVPEWSPDSTRLLMRAIHPDLKKAQILVADAASGKTRVVQEESDAAWVNTPEAAWSPDGKEVLFTSEQDGWSHLYVVSVEGGPPRQVTRGNWEVHTERTFGREPQWVGDYIYYSSTEAGTAERQFYRVRPDGSGKTRLSERESLNLGYVSEDGRYLALLSADSDNPFDLYVNGRRVTTSPRPEFAQYPWPRTRFIQIRSRDKGTPVAARLMLPPGYDPADRAQKPRPAIVYIHGSGYATSVLRQWGSYQPQRYVFNCYLANRGYVIIEPDYRGSSGYGRGWRTGVYLHMGGPDLDDVLGAVDYLRGLANIDMQRVGIWGWSYGGFMTDMALFRSPGTFRAGAAFAAVTDWENYNAFYTQQRLTRPKENAEAYRRSSPITFAGDLKDHLLIVHGMVDSNVLFQDDVQLTEKLIHLGKQFEEAYYPEENHLFVRDESLRDAFSRAARFFERYLR